MSGFWWLQHNMFTSGFMPFFPAIYLNLTWPGIFTTAFLYNVLAQIACFERFKLTLGHCNALGQAKASLPPRSWKPSQLFLAFSPLRFFMGCLLTCLKDPNSHWLHRLDHQYEKRLGIGAVRLPRSWKPSQLFLAFHHCVYLWFVVFMICGCIGFIINMKRDWAMSIALVQAHVRSPPRSCKTSILLLAFHHCVYCDYSHGLFWKI